MFSPVVQLFSCIASTCLLVADKILSLKDSARIKICICVDDETLEKERYD